ncbi:MAG: hypothetical protein K2K75_00875 [Muribaculaceae bacterium]|nr:hypothetical protein [Muribaculaceae bacterium]
MGNKNQQEFMDELVKEFGIEPAIFKCYTLQSDPSIRIFFFGKGDWASGHIGILINGNFHVLGLGEFSFTNEDKKALYVRLRGTLPKDKEVLVVNPQTPFSDEEQRNIKNKLKDLF